MIHHFSTEQGLDQLDYQQMDEIRSNSQGDSRVKGQVTDQLGCGGVYVSPWLYNLVQLKFQWPTGTELGNIPKILDIVPNMIR